MSASPAREAALAAAAKLPARALPALAPGLREQARGPVGNGTGIAQEGLGPDSIQVAPGWNVDYQTRLASDPKGGTGTGVDVYAHLGDGTPFMVWIPDEVYVQGVDTLRRLLAAAANHAMQVGMMGTAPVQVAVPFPAGQDG